MKRYLFFRFILLLFILLATIARSQNAFPLPDHVVVVILENHSYEQIIGSTAAPYINSLAKDTSSALFTQSYGITHPSQPNYLILFSGSNQGVKDDSFPKGSPFTTPNIAHQMITSGRTFITFSEDLPQVGYNGESSNNYFRRHNPGANWMGKGINQISPLTNKPFTDFPGNNFTLLPTLCFVNPSTLNDMHDGTDPSRIKSGDTWILNNIENYIQWAKTNNSLFILTFDEDNDSSNNHITTIFTGQMVKGGQYSTKINHYSVLHTLEKMFGLYYIGDSINYAPIDNCWKSIIQTDSIRNGLVYPNPTSGLLYIEMQDYLNAKVEIYNLKGQLIQVSPLLSGKTGISVDHLSQGFYLMRIRNKEGSTLRKFLKN